MKKHLTKFAFGCNIKTMANAKETLKTLDDKIFKAKLNCREYTDVNSSLVRLSFDFFKRAFVKLTSALFIFFACDTTQTQI